jgi:serine/threonine protein kinase
VVDYIDEKRNCGEMIALFLFKQLIEALEYIHTKGYCHKDIKPDNLLFDKDFNLLLCDFSFSLPLADPANDLFDEARFKGTKQYKSPEMHANMPFDEKAADVFAAGKTLFLLALGKHPFTSSIKEDSYYSLLLSKKYDRFWNYHTRKVSASSLPTTEFRDFFQRLVEPDPTKRITIPEIKKHAWFNSQAATTQQVQMFLQEKRRDFYPEIAHLEGLCNQLYRELAHSTVLGAQETKQHQPHIRPVLEISSQTLVCGIERVESIEISTSSNSVEI